MNIVVTKNPDKTAAYDEALQSLARVRGLARITAAAATSPAGVEGKDLADVLDMIEDEVSKAKKAVHVLRARRLASGRGKRRTAGE
jgi:hypothetical protein